MKITSVQLRIRSLDINVRPGVLVFTCCNTSHTYGCFDHVEGKLTLASWTTSAANFLEADSWTTSEPSPDSKRAAYSPWAHRRHATDRFGYAVTRQRSGGSSQPADRSPAARQVNFSRFDTL
jgi:hypothetical protein